MYQSVVSTSVFFIVFSYSSWQFERNLVYFFTEIMAKITPKARIPIQENTVILQPRKSETKAIPYIDAAAPT